MNIINGISRIFGMFCISACLHVATVFGGGDPAKVDNASRYNVRAIQAEPQVSEIHDAA
jgi:hypothetical protein